MDPTILLAAQRELLAPFASNPRIAQAAAHLMGLDVSSIHVDRPLSNMIVEYQNRDYIGDLVMPVVTVAKRSDKYFQFGPAELLSVEQTDVSSQRGMPHEISSQVAADGSYSVTDDALVYWVGADELTNADAPLQPMAVGNRKLYNALALAQESRIATVVFDSGNYGANTAALTGGSKWDQSTSDPVQAIDDAIEACLVRPTHLVLGGQVWPKIRNHPKFKELILSRAGSSVGVSDFRVVPKMLAEAFDLEGVYIGRAKKATQVEGQTFASDYLWGKNAALVRIEPQPSIQMTATFGYQFQFGSWETRQIPDFLHGVRGGTFLKQSFSRSNKVIGAPYTSYLFTGVVS